MVAGILKPTVLVVPTRVATLVAVVDTAAPTLGVNLTVTADGEIVPPGKSDPVTVTVVTPA
jgi:hypothetical protein